MEVMEFLTRVSVPPQNELECVGKNEVTAFSLCTSSPYQATPEPLSPRRTIPARERQGEKRVPSLYSSKPLQ